VRRDADELVARLDRLHALLRQPSLTLDLAEQAFLVDLFAQFFEAVLVLAPFCLAQELCLPLHVLRLAVKLHEHVDLREQDLGYDGLEQEVDRAERVALVHVFVGILRGGQEDDRHMARALAPADELGNLEAALARHAHVQQDQREVLLHHLPQRGVPRADADQVRSRAVEHGLERAQVGGIVVDREDADRFRRHDLQPAL
jgi:hypothetical protein